MYALKAIRCKTSKVRTDKLVMLYDGHGTVTTVEIRDSEGNSIPELTQTGAGKVIFGAELMDKGYSAWVNRKWVLDLKTEHVQGDWEN